MYNKIEPLFPEILRNSDDYQVLIKLAGYCFDTRQKQIDEFTDLVDVDKCPSEFLPLLGNLLGYDYRYNISADYNREIIKNLFRIYSMRGTEESIILAATHFLNEGYVGGDIFLPNTYKELESARLEYPRDVLHKHSTRSSYSGSHKRADNGLFQEGVMELVVSVFTDKIKDLVEKVKPAGLRIKFRLEVVPLNPDPIIDTSNEHHVIEHEIFLDITNYLPHQYAEPSKGYSRSARSTNLTLSGRQVLIGDRFLDILYRVDATRKLLQNSPIKNLYDASDDLVDEPTDLQLPTYVLHPRRGDNSYSSTSKLSSSRCRSGLTGIDHTYIEYRRSPLFSNPIYTIGDLANQTLGGTRLDYQDLNVHDKPSISILSNPNPNYGSISNTEIEEYRNSTLSSISTGLIIASSSTVTTMLGCDVVIYRSKDGEYL